VVLVALRPLAVPNPLEDALLDEPAKTVGEYVAGDAETLLELVEAAKAKEGVADDQQRPPRRRSREHGAIEHSWPSWSRLSTRLAAVSFFMQLIEEEMGR
jgi:hypothetical protein